MRTDAHMHILPDKDKELYDQYIHAHQIEALIGIYDEISDVYEINSFDCAIYMFYWIHQPNILPDHLPDGLKFESWIDEILIDEKVIYSALNFASKNEIPILIHCNQLRPDLSRPSRVEKLSKKYDDLNFIIAHSGSYGPPLRDDLAGLKLMKTLVNEAIEVCERFDNIFLESSIIASPRKRKLIIENLDRIKDRLLIGTDFPLTLNELLEDRFLLKQDYAPTITSEESFLLNEGLTRKELEEIYKNIYKLF
ncbi:MAG: amidohydrolase family protein [Promethearchaeota archaeon]